MKPKLCYVLPEYDGPKTSRFFYIWELLENLSRTTDIYLVIEKRPQEKIQSAKFHVYSQLFSKPPFNILERLLVFSWLNVKGYQNIYVYYSIFSSIVASLTVRLFGGASLYWYCQMYTLYKHKWWESSAFRLNLRLISFLITGNEGMKDYFQKTFDLSPEKIVPFPLWINLRRFHPDAGSRQQVRRELEIGKSPLVLFLHGLSPRKGADKIIPIAKKVWQTDPKVKFLIVGGGELEDSLRQQISAEGLEKHIILLGPKSNLEIPRYYSAADVFLMPSKEEEFGRVILEAMASGVPLAATDTLGPRSIMTDNEKNFLAKFPDINDFARKILQILGDKKSFVRLQNDGLQTAQKYSLPDVALSLSQLLNSLDLKGRTKVCYVLSEYDPGISSHYRHIYELLPEIGKRLDIFLFLEQSRIKHPMIENLSGISVQRFNVFPINLPVRLFYFLSLRLRGYRIFYVHYSIFSSITAAIVCRLFGGRCYYWHCQSRHKYEVPFRFSLAVIWSKISQDWSFRLNLKLIDKLVTCTQEMRDYYKKYYQVDKSRSAKFSLWVNLDRFKKNEAVGKKLRRRLGLVNKKVVLFVHWLSPRKGADKIVSVASLVLPKVPDARFLIVGGGPLLETLKKETASVGLEEKVIFTGPVPNFEVPNYYNVADLFFMPITENGFGRVLLEAMAFGLPAVASNTLGPQELFNGSQRKYLVGPENIDGFAKKIIKLLVDEKSAEELSQANIELVKEFGLTQAVDNFVQLVS